MTMTTNAISEFICTQEGLKQYIEQIWRGEYRQDRMVEVDCWPRPGHPHITVRDGSHVVAKLQLKLNAIDAGRQANTAWGIFCDTLGQMRNNLPIDAQNCVANALRKGAIVQLVFQPNGDLLRAVVTSSQPNETLWPIG